MKTLLTLFIILTSTVVSFSQGNDESKNYFIVFYTIGESWDSTKQAHEQLYFNEHSTHLSELRKTKKISIGGRYSDTGMLLMEAKDLAEAQNIINKDIAIQKKLFKVEIFHFDPFYNGCIK